MRKLLLIFLFGFTINAQAQNLVPNPSFEDTVSCLTIGSCPNDLGQTCIINEWNYNGFSPDYFHSCSGLTAGVPNNIFGYQYPSGGLNGYIGLYIRSGGGPNIREYLGVKLINPLVAGERYYASFSATLADCFKCATDKFGLLFTTTELNFASPNLLSNFSHVFSETIQTNKTDWFNISKTFISDSAYRFLYIGNFFDDLQTDTLMVPAPECPPWFFSNSHCYSYYYFDNICVSSDSLLCDPSYGFKPVNNETSLTIFPTPTKDNLNLNSNQIISQFILYSVLGTELLRKEVNGYFYSMNISFLSKGIYFIQVQVQDKTIYKKIIIN